MTQTPEFGPPTRHGRRRRSWLVPTIVAAALVVAAAVAVPLVVVDSRHSATAAGRATVTVPAPPPTHPAPPAPASRPPSPAASPSAPPTRTVHVTSLESDDATYGIGMPIVLYLSPAPTDARAFEQAVTVTVDGKPAHGAWYWEQPTADEVASHTVEAHYRLPGYWPANSRIHVDVPIKGRSAGTGLAYGGGLTSLDYKIGDAHVSRVEADGLSMVVTDNGQQVKRFPVSLGKASTPTFNGPKVVMQKGEDVPGTDRLRAEGTVLMNGPGYTDDPVKWSVRITRSGEYVHDASWNGNIGARSTSNGCTNLHADDAKWFYGFSQVGDVVTYDGTDGSTMPSWDGLGDWNLTWAQWTEGGLLSA